MKIIKELEAINWDFKRYRQRGIDNIHWYPANFIPQIPSILIANLSTINSTVLDPFCGSGTTLVESARLGRICLGVDINYLAFIVTKAKITYIEPEKLIELKNRFELLLHNKSTNSILIPDFPNREKWYHKGTLEELGKIFYSINTLDDFEEKNLLLVCFSSILKKCCTQMDHYTYVADNMFAKKTENILYINALKAFENHLRKTVDSLLNFYDDIKEKGLNVREILTECKMFNADARTLDIIESDTVDLVVTSPPYANVMDYTTGNRLTYYWLYQSGFNTNKQNEIGARWKRARKKALDDYLEEMKASFLQIRRVLKRDALFCCILGETSSIGKKIDLNYELIEVIAQNIGFKILSNSIERNIYAKRIRASRGVNREHIYILQNVK